MPYKNKKDHKEYILRYQRTWLARRRADFFADKRCVRCGSVANLELDHRDPSTKVTNAIWSLVESSRLAEIAKCDVLCRRCHQEKTSANDIHRAPHGSLRMYRIGCRCQDCVATKRLSGKNSHAPVRSGRASPIKWTKEMDAVATSKHAGAAASELGITTGAVYRRRDSMRISSPGTRYPYQDLPKLRQSGD